MAVEGMRPLAQVVEAGSGAFTAQCYELETAPPLGALVRAGTPPAYAVVVEVTTGTLEPGRRLLPRGQDLPSEEALFHENPHLRLLLGTRFRAVLVGWEEEGEVRHHLPPHPPRILSFVHPCTPEGVVRFTGSLDFLHTLVAQGPALDEALAACLRWAALARSAGARGDFLRRAGRVLAVELVGQAHRLQAILRRLGPIPEGGMG